MQMMNFSNMPKRQLTDSLENELRLCDGENDEEEAVFGREEDDPDRQTTYETEPNLYADYLDDRGYPVALAEFPVDASGDVWRLQPREPVPDFYQPRTNPGSSPISSYKPESFVFCYLVDGNFGTIILILIHIRLSLSFSCFFILLQKALL